MDARGVPMVDPRGVPVDLVIVSVESFRRIVLGPVGPRMVDDSLLALTVCEGDGCVVE